MLDTNNNISSHTTDYAELSDDLKPLSDKQIALLKLLGLGAAGIERAKANRNRRIVKDARLKQRQRRQQIYRETGRMVQQ